MREMQAIKGMLEQQLAGFAWGDLSRNSPIRALLLSEMIEAGFSGQLARRLVSEMPADIGLDEGRKWLMAAVSRRRQQLGDGPDERQHLRLRVAREWNDRCPPSAR